MSQEELRYSVLIADDVIETRRSTRLMLTLVPELKVVAIAQNGRQAVEMAKTFRPDIALMDVNMPEMDGLTAIKRMMSLSPHMACVVISAERDVETLREAVKVGALEYLLKPFTSEEFIPAMGRAMAHVQAHRNKSGENQRIREQRHSLLLDLAQEYARARRTDDKAIRVFEELATDPNCQQRWLMTLAMIYVIRKKWGDLKVLAARLEKQTSGAK